MHLKCTSSFVRALVMYLIQRLLKDRVVVIDIYNAKIDRKFSEARRSAVILSTNREV